MTKGNGFTLIELLVAMVAGSLLLATLSWCLATLGRELRWSGQQGEQKRLEIAGPAINHLIEQMLPTAGGGEAIGANAERLVMITEPPAALGPTGPIRASLSVRNHGGRKALFARLEPADPKAIFPEAARAERRLVDGYEEISFHYASAHSASEDVLPRLVTISFTDSKGDISRLTSTPRMNSGGDCRFDPISMTCRR